jgi:hypothetical protein
MRSIIALNASGLQRYFYKNSVWAAHCHFHLQNHFHDAYGVLRTVQQNASKIRETFLEDRAEHLAATHAGVTKADALRQLIAAERALFLYI